MYIDLIIFFVLLILVMLKYNKFHSYVLFIAIIDIALRILTFVRGNIPIREVSKFIGDYLPNSLLDLIVGSIDVTSFVLSFKYCS